MERDIQACRYTITPITVDDEFVQDPATWLAQKAAKYELTWLLAHAYNGVIWGKREDERLALSSEAFPDVSPPLLVTTLQQVRLFGKDAELMLWRDGENKWRGRLLDDRGAANDGWRFDEAQVLWGDRQEGEKQDFTLVAEGRQGLRHAVPLAMTEIPFDSPDVKHDRWHPLRLNARQYVDHDQDGMAFIVQGRLVKLDAIERQGGSNG
jgi:CRISPR-associated protein (TIGR03984 family)